MLKRASLLVLQSRLIRLNLLAASGLLIATASGGCGVGPGAPQPLTADSFVQRRSNQEISGPVDKPQPTLYNNVHYDLIPGGQGNPNDAPAHPNQLGISKTVRDSVRSPEDAATQSAAARSASPATAPTTAISSESTTQPSQAASASDSVSTGFATTQPGGASIGEAWTVGSVMANVNDTPIYADKVLATIDRPLRAEAKRSSEEVFRRFAADQINRQVMEFVHAELEFAAAQRNLESKDEQLVRGETTMWRGRQIAMAGGSLELAKQKARDDGRDFEELCRQHYRETMTQLYFQRKVWPLIQVSASDLRNYYDQHRSTEFTQPAEAKFLVIKISVAATGSREAAMDKIQGIQARLKGGADFATVAGQINDDKLLLESKGDVHPGGWMEKGAYRVIKVEDAVWKLQPGQLTDVIDDGDAIYLAKLVERRGGTTDSFQDQAVQERIHDTLRRQQFNVLREGTRAELEKQAIISFNPDMMQTALQMVMQRYPRWARASAQ